MFNIQHLLYLIPIWLFCRYFVKKNKICIVHRRHIKISLNVSLIIKKLYFVFFVYFKHLITDICDFRVCF